VITTLFAMMLAGAAQQLPASTSIEVTAPGPSGALKGTLMEPGKRGEPVILIVPGSGPTDRDGNNRLGVAASTYRLLAEALAKESIASVRIDKRGMFGSAAAVPDANAVTIDDYAADVHAWVRVIKQRMGTRCVWVLGHSEGGLVALQAAQRSDGICGLILLAAPGRPMGDILKAQLRVNPANAALLPDADRAINTLTAGGRIDPTTLQAPLRPLFPSVVQGFLVSAFALDPAQLIRSAKLPVLKEVASADRAANLATYAATGLPLAPTVIPAIRVFIGQSR
jgi:pimeloyl-ACP methyl ester carboxylesterase